MTRDDSVSLRDFLYLDVERVKSLLAQADRGLLRDWSDSTEKSNSVKGKAGLSIPALVEIGGTGNYVATNQSTETLTLHDFVYNQTEERLRDLGRITVLPDDYRMTDKHTDGLRTELSSAEYILIRGKVELHDYEYMRSLLGNINDFNRIFTEVGYQEQIDSLDGKHKSDLRNKIKTQVEANKLDERYVKNLLRILDFFPKDRLSIKVTPFSEEPNLRIVGPLQRVLLRERLEDIRFKYGASPVEDWAVFGQIAAIPEKDEARSSQNLSFSNGLEGAFQTVFDSLRGIDDEFRIRYPEIAITPIAVYRD